MAFKGPAARGGSEKDIRRHKGRRSVRRRFALLFAVALAPFSIGVAGACGGAKEEPVEDRQERRTNQGPVQEPEPPQPTHAEPTTRKVGENVQG
jgi:hypothetical protein